MSTCKALAYSYFTIVLYIFRVCYSILDIYHAFKYKVVCHAVVLYDENLSGYRCLVRGVHGCVFGECRLARHLLAFSYFTIVLYIFSHVNINGYIEWLILCHAVLLCVVNLFKLLSILLILLIVRRIILT